MMNPQGTPRNLVGAHAGMSGLNEELTSIFPPRFNHYDPAHLAVLARGMQSAADTVSNDPDPEENLYVPAGYTYFGQFIDHDLTLDTTSQLTLIRARKTGQLPTNLRTPRFDLDNVYGPGPDDAPYMYADENHPHKGIYQGASLIEGHDDLPRTGNAYNARAIIGDKRNDENSIVCQIQMLFLRFHNRVVARLAKADVTLRGSDLFEAARAQVRWAYQRVLVEDFLRRIVDSSVVDAFVTAHEQDRAHAYKLYGPGPARRNLPREFTGAAYRYGHSGVRNGYVLNDNFSAPIFDGTNANKDSLVGFDRLPETHVIDDWQRVFPREHPLPGEKGGPGLDGANKAAPGVADNASNDVKRLQYAYKFDPSIVDPLSKLPHSVSDVPIPDAANNLASAKGFRSLAMLNLLRGNVYGLPSGETVASALGVTPLGPDELVVRTQVSSDPSKTFRFDRIASLNADGESPALGDTFKDDTPLWFYILAEAQRPVLELAPVGETFSEDDMLGTQDGKLGVGALTRLGPVGGRIVVEVFYGLLDEDPDSIIHRIGSAPALEAEIFSNAPATFSQIIAFATAGEWRLIPLKAVVDLAA
ncbi:peroxidase family protein [Paraburkholderia sp. BR10872]|uniref:peroxidase family protein n=1 Tax=Paraburkholderia sp. BR10872 TaxID=3236989 RepID=UPI0034D1B7B0